MELWLNFKTNFIIEA